VAFTVKSVELPNRVKLPYVEQGDASGVPLVLLHGLADSWRSFELLLPHLPDSVRAFALTQRGHGDASRPAVGYRTDDFVADLVAFMDALHLDAAVVAGASSGGFVARRFAVDHPGRTHGLALVGSPFTLWDKPGVLELWDSTVSKLRDPIDPDFVRAFQKSTLARRAPRAFLERLVRESLSVPAFVWKMTVQGLLADDCSGELDKIRAPTLILWGDRDAILDRSDQEALAAAIPGSRLVVYPGGGHAFYWERPDRVASDLVAFVEELSG
jgi:non-heme chloroperoxidase